MEYYQAKDSPESVAIYCNILINRFPDTVYAERSREILEAQARSAYSRLSLPQLPRRKATAAAPADEPEAEEEAEAEEAVPEKKIPLKFPRLWWPAKPVPSEADEDADSSASEEMPLEEVSTEKRSASGRASLE